ncbi:PREDICTED: calcium-binding and coiled-coil domain-containing protein 2 isoform X2 [Corvus brachyrhynchos]|nr:PREDICTED: calcium-binding and coiled-coil domain-containing protein 2 isoform X2 [Corvus brachyrhynchos]
MEDSPEEPPSSCVLLERCHFSQVLFTNVEKFYVPGTDVTCHYSLSPGIVPRGKDWVGIFQVGWKTTREYFTFLWAPVPAAGTTQQQIHFKAYYLPKDDEHYQFCYVDQDGAVRGASVPFQFRPEADDDILVVTTQGEVEEVELQNQKLRGENEELRGSCAELRQRNLQLQGELRSARELQEALESLRSSTERLELELNSLKSENRALKEQGGCREAELQRLKEQIQGVNSDKERLEGRLRAALEHLDQLQSKVSDYEKEVENLSRAEQDKTKQLQSLKGENQELLQTSAQHQVKPSLQGLRPGTAPDPAQSLENLRNFRKREISVVALGTGTLSLDANASPGARFGKEPLRKFSFCPDPCGVSSGMKGTPGNSGILGSAFGAELLPLSKIVSGIGFRGK